MYTNLVLLQKGIDKITSVALGSREVKEALLQTIESYMLEYKCTQLASIVTIFACQLHGVNLDDQKSQRMTLLSPETKLTLKRELPSDVANVVIKLWVLSTAGRRNVGDFMTHLENVVHTFQLVLCKVDRKVERAFLFKTRHEKNEKLQSCTNNLRIGCLVWELLLQQLYAIVIVVPEEAQVLQSVFHCLLHSKIPSGVAPDFEAFLNVLTVTEVEEDSQAQEGIVKRMQSFGLLKDIQQAV